MVGSCGILKKRKTEGNCHHQNIGTSASSGGFFMMTIFSASWTLSGTKTVLGIKAVWSEEFCITQQAHLELIASLILLFCQECLMYSSIRLANQSLLLEGVYRNALIYIHSQEHLFDTSRISWFHDYRWIENKFLFFELSVQAEAFVACHMKSGQLPWHYFLEILLGRLMSKLCIHNPNLCEMF